MPEPCLGAGTERAELRHREDAAAAADSFSAVEDRPPGRDEECQADRNREQECDDEEDGREEQIERSQLEIDPPPVGRLLSETRITFGKALSALHSQGH